MGFRNAFLSYLLHSFPIPTTANHSRNIERSLKASQQPMCEHLSILPVRNAMLRKMWVDLCRFPARNEMNIGVGRNLVIAH